MLQKGQTANPLCRLSLSLSPLYFTPFFFFLIVSTRVNPRCLAEAGSCPRKEAPSSGEGAWRTRWLTVIDEASPSPTASFFFFLTFICSEGRVGVGMGMYMSSWYPRLGMHAGRGAKLKIAADSNTLAKMTRPGFVNPHPPTHTFPCCYPTHSPSCPPTHSLWFILPASLSLCQNAVLYCHPAYQLSPPP